MAEDITTAPNLKKKKTMVSFTFVLGYVFKYRDTHTMTFNYRRLVINLQLIWKQRQLLLRLFAK